MEYRSTIRIAAFEGTLRLEMEKGEVKDKRITDFIDHNRDRSNESVGRALSNKSGWWDRYILMALNDLYETRVKKLTRFKVDVVLKDGGDLDLMVIYQISIKVPVGKLIKIAVADLETGV